MTTSARPVLFRAPERRGPDIRAIADAVKDKLRIEDVIAKTVELEVHGTDELLGWHTVHQSDSKRSLAVSREKQVYHCWNCGAGGDVLDWLGHERFNSDWEGKGDQFIDVLREAAATAGVEFEESEEAKQVYVERRQVEAVLTAAADYYHSQLPDEMRQHLVAQYGLATETIDRLKIGYAPPGGQQLHTALQMQGLVTEAIAAAGVLIDPSGRGSFKDLFEGRLIFPYWQRGKVIYLIGRQTRHTPTAKWEDGKYKKLLSSRPGRTYVSPALGGAALYGLDSLRGKSTCLLTEGITDAIAAHQHGFACLSPVTVRFAKKDIPGLVEALKGKTVYIVNDQEESQAGELGARDTADLLWLAGVQAWLVTLPRPCGVEKIDLNEFLRDQGTEPLRALLREAVSPLDLAMEAIEAAPRAERIHELGRLRDLTTPFDTDVLAPWAERLAALGISLSVGSHVVTQRDRTDSASDESVPPFPIEVLPEAFRTFAEEAAASLVAPVDFVAVPLLVLAGAVVGGAIELEIKPGWHEAPHLFAAVIGDPGSKKTPALTQASKPIYWLQKQLKDAYDAKKAEFDRELTEWELLPKKSRGDKPIPPTFEHVVTTDVTTEALAVMLQSAKGLACIKDELVGWVKGMDQYRGGKGQDRQHYLSFWSRTPTKVDRKGGEPIFVSKPCLSVCGGVQPDLLPELADSAKREDGFPDRLLWSYPDPIPDDWNDAGIQLETLQAVENVFQSLYRFKGTRVVTFSSGAHELWCTWYRDRVAEMRSPTFPQRLRGPWSKLPSQFARLALILHALSDGPDAPELSAETLGRAADLVDYFKGHAVRVYRALNKQQRDLPTDVLVALKEHGELTKRQFIHDVFKRNLPAERIAASLEELEDAGLIKRETRQGGTGRPAEVWSRA